MGIDVSASTEIERAPADVAAFAMEAENDTRWIGGISSARRLTDGPTAVGTRVERVASFMGKRIDYVMEVVELEPGRRIVLRSIKSPFPMRVTYAFEPAGAGTRASVRVEGEAEGFYKLAGGLMAPAVRKNLNGDVKRLKGIMESSPTTRVEPPGTD
ncbi:MAG TPA: SRPBCC family protein [Actinomycetota bacterium]|nr:SRPBCC family protein [Actinomycetota bacterium]